VANKKISIVMAYHNRADLLRTTLESYELLYSDIKDSIEIVIVDDSSDDREELTAVLADFSFEFKTDYLDRKDKAIRNPCVPYNMAIKMAEGEYVNLTNPENAHLGHIVQDALARACEDKYLIYACMNLKVKPEDYASLKGHLGRYVEPDPSQAWYQHSKYSNRLLHFCSVINRKRLLDIGGFDERLADGSGYDDNDLIQTVVGSGMEIENIDYPYCAHQPHSRNWDQDSTMYNLTIIKDKWGFFPISAWRLGAEAKQLEEKRARGGAVNDFIFKV